MDNTLQITNGKITLNGAPVHCVKSFDFHSLEDNPCMGEVNMTFDVPFHKFKPVNAEAEQPEEPHLNITIDGETVCGSLETEKSSLYRDSLEKQLEFLEEAQESARFNDAFESILAYSYKILELSKEIDQLDNDETVDESVDQSTIHQLEISTEREKLLRFALAGVTHAIYDCNQPVYNMGTACKLVIREQELKAYRSQLEQELDKLISNG